MRTAEGPAPTRRCRHADTGARSRRRASAKSAVEVWTTAGASTASGPAENPWSGDDDDRQQEFADSAGQSLQEHLLWQLELARLDAARAGHRARHRRCHQRRRLSERAAGGDRRTRLQARRLDASRAEVERVLGDRAGARPAGRRRALGRRMHRAAAAAARSGAPPGFDTAIEIARHHLELRGGAASSSLLRRELRATDEELASALALVRSCHPRPGATVSAGSAEYVVPDVFVRRTDARLGGRDQCRDAAARAPQPELRQPHRAQRQPRQHARAAAGGALAAQEPGDPPRDAHQGGALDRRAPDASSSSTARSTCGR